MFSELKFRSALRKEIHWAIARLDKGTVGISEDNLWQLTSIPAQFAPQGTNAAYIVRQMFNDIVRGKAYSHFVYRS